VSALLKNRPYLLTMLGLALMGQSVLWEYVRMDPTYRFVVEPWSIRGFTTTQGRVILFAAVWLGLVTTLMVLGKIKETVVNSVVVVTLTSLVPVGAAVATSAKPLALGGMGVVLMALLATVVINVVVARFWLSNRVKGAARFGVRFVMWVGGLLILILAVLGPTFGSRSAPAWVVFAIVFGLMAVLAITRPPERLAVWRMLINGVAALWLMSITMAASLRWDLLNQQLANMGVSSEIGDAGITSGILMCWIGGLLAFMGSVSLWAKRRDLIAARDRARHQQEAARESQQQLAEATV